MYIGILLGAHPILHISRIKVNKTMNEWTHFINPASIPTILYADAQVILTTYIDMSPIVVR
jgi:hypothetical protein